MMPMTNGIGTVLGFGLAVGVAASCSTSQSQTVQSPHGNLTFTLRGSTNAPRLPLVTSIVVGSVNGKDGDLCTAVELHRAHWFDTAFDDLYMPPSWERENALRFRAPRRASSESTDRLSIRNNTDQSVPCLKVLLSDLVLVVDVKAGEAVELGVSRASGGVVDFSAEAKGLSTPIAPANLMFDRSDYPPYIPVTCTITIAKDRLSLAVSASS